MSEDTKKSDLARQAADAGELTEQDLEIVAGGSVKDIDGVDVIIKNKGKGKPKPTAS